MDRDNLNNREGQTDSTPVDKYFLIGLQKAFDVSLIFNYRGPLYINIEGGGD